jgi:hypothetical protein
MFDHFRGDVSTAYEFGCHWIVVIFLRMDVLIAVSGTWVLEEEGEETRRLADVTT